MSSSEPAVPTPAPWPRSRRGEAWLVVGLLVVVGAFHAVVLKRFPAPYVDEAWAAARAWSFRTTLAPFSTLDSGVFDRLPGYGTFFPYSPTALQSLAYVGAVTPSLLPLRAESLALGLLLLVALFEIGRALYGPRAGAYAVVIVGASLPFFISAHFARYDIHAAVLGYWAIALYLGNRGKRWGRYFAAGTLAVLTLDAHPHGIVTAAGFPLLFWLEDGLRALRTRGFWAFVAGCLTGASIYAAIHVVRYPHSFAEFNRLAFALTHVPPLLTLRLDVMWRALLEFGESFESSTANLMGLAAVAAVTLAIRRSPGDKRLLALSCSILLAVTLLIRIKQRYYEILYWPCIGLMLAALLDLAWSAARQRAGLYRVLAGVISVAIALGSWANLPDLSEDLFVPYQAIAKRVRAFARPGDKIMSNQNYWFALYDHVYYSCEGINYYQRYAPGTSLEQAFAAFQPDLLIVDSMLTPRITDEPGESLYGRYLSLPRSELFRMLDRRGKVLGRFMTTLYGEIVVIRLRWDDWKAPTSAPPDRADLPWRGSH
jgi:hypothetical protein